MQSDSVLIRGGRFEHLFADHVIAEGTFRSTGYLLRIPSHNGHWIAIVPPEDNGEEACERALLCDSIYRAPILLQLAEVVQLLAAAAFDAVAARRFNAMNFDARWGCFLTAREEAA